MTKDETTKATGIGPESAFKRIAITEEPETDAEGNVLKASPIPDDSGLGPEHDIKLPDALDGQPGDADSARYSDRDLKVAIIPVVW